jgi:Uma2 family endonuclease
MVVREHLATVQEFEDFIRKVQNHDRRFELIHGAIVEKPMPRQEHGIIVLRIGSRILIWIEQGGRGRVGTEIRHRVPGDLHNDRIPDIAYYVDSTVPVVTQGAVPTLPDLAIEVKSPDDTYKEMRAKAAYYLVNGTTLVWLIFPEKRVVEVYGQDFEDVLVEGDTLNGGDLLPGFEMAVVEIFAV